MTRRLRRHFPLQGPLRLRPALAAGACAVAALLIAGCDDVEDDDITQDSDTIKVEIRRGSYGVPHIVAKDMRSAAYGLAYSYAQDNVCTAALQFVTVAGERAKYLGAGTGNANVRSDFFHRAMFDQAALDKAFAGASPLTLEAIKGYVEGYNRFLADARPSDFAAECSSNGAPTAWARRPLDENDYKRHVLALATQSGAAALQGAIVDAQPPAGVFAAAPGGVVRTAGAGSAGDAAEPADATALRRSAAEWAQRLDDGPLGSNGFAFGSAATDNGRGVLVGNPHFPWAGANRFYQAHVRIPGQYDVMGATLGPAPIIVIGFNRDVAWTHTVSTGRRFTLHELTLSGRNYVVDGVAKPVASKPVTVEVLGSNGATTTQTQTFYSTEHGPMIVSAALGATWTATKGYALRDANIDNGRFFQQWWEMGRATSTEELRQAAARHLALPWVNTIAADRAGNALYMDYSVVPNVSAALLASCATSPQAQALAAARTFLLDGSRAACNWAVDASTPVAGLMPASALPFISRADYAGNSNDSAWLANPAQLLTGFSPLVGAQAQAQSLRTRMAFTQVQDRLAGSDGLPGNKVSVEDLEAVFFQNRVMSAELVRAPLVALCRATPSAAATNGSVVDLAPACSVLAAWDGRARTDSVGTHVFREFWRRAQGISGLWATPFNAQSPVTTPRDPAVNTPAVAGAMLRALADGVQALAAAGVALDARLGDIQTVTRNGVRIPISGGDEFEGVFNKITPPGLTAGGYTSVVSGSSHIQIVGFTEDGVNARGILTYSQSTNPASPYYADQTQVFGTNRLVKLPFSEAEIAADPNLMPKIVLGVR